MQAKRLNSCALSLIASGYLNDIIHEFYTQLTSLTVKLSLSSLWKKTRGAEVWLHSFLTSAPDGSEWSRHVPQDRTPRYPLHRRLDAHPPPHPEPVQNFGGRDKKSCAYRDSNPGPICPSPIRYTK
jgi:hypothetical protein